MQMAYPVWHSATVLPEARSDCTKIERNKPLIALHLGKFSRS